MRGETLEQLEGHIWPPADDDSYLVSTVHRLRKKPLAEFTVEDLRIMLGQGVGLPHLMPRAVGVLEREPLAEGDFYPGDLLSSVIQAESWLVGRPALASRVIAVARRVLAEAGGVDPELRGRVAEFIKQVRAAPGAAADRPRG
jgi:contact-dependent growth inhibition (CDI) system CdiI-like immunity protein